MKKHLFRTAAVTAALVLCLSGCGGDSAEAPAQTPTPTPAPTPVVTATPAPVASDYETALEFVDMELAELIDAIGEPLEQDYVSSCLGPGKDGELVYDGFTVYTYKEGSSEIVRVVLES